MKLAQPKGKIASIEMFRVLAILAVVTLHARPFFNVTGAEPLFYLIRGICRFAVPFFFIVSGYFYGKKVLEGASPQSLFLRVLTKLTPLYFLWSFLYLSNSFLGVHTLGEKGFLAMMSHAFSQSWAILASWWPRNWELLFFQGWPSPFYHLWFLPAMICGYAVLTFLIAARRQTWLIPVSSVLLFLGTPYSHLLGIALDFNTRNGPFFSAFFLVLGYLFALKDWKPSAGLALTLLLGGWIFQNAEFYFFHSWFRVPPDFDFTLATIPYAAGIFGLALARPEWGTEGPWQRWAGFTLTVYLIHMFFADSVVGPLRGRLDALPLFLRAAFEISLPFILYFLSLGIAMGISLLKKEKSEPLLAAGAS